LNETLDWIRDYHSRNQAQPFFVYQGMNIVHPPYHTNDYWLQKIDKSKIMVPQWPRDLSKMHPCDVHQSMLKGCFPVSEEDAVNVYSVQRRRQIRRIYYAMIAEFDAMVGRYMDLLDELGLADNTILMVTSDHGDMQMEHAQFYKMSPYDASSSVPLIIYDPRRRAVSSSSGNPHHQVVQDHPTQHVDLFPTILDLAGLGKTSDIPKDLDGHSLVPFLDRMQQERNGPDQAASITTHRERITTETTRRGLRTSTNENDDDDDEEEEAVEVDDSTSSTGDRPPFVVTQYHGDDSPMSWFAIVQAFPCMATLPTSNLGAASSLCMYKLVIWGTGQQVDSQLFALTHDPDENDNLIHDPDYELIVGGLNTNLESVVDYRAVAQDVARYNRDSFRLWKERYASNWTDILNASSLRWHSSWSRNATQSIAAIEDWLAHGDPAQVQGCKREAAWPPSP